MRKRRMKVSVDAPSVDAFVPIKPKAGQQLGKPGAEPIGIVQMVRADKTFKLQGEQPTRWPCTWENVQHQGYRFTDKQGGD